MHGSADLSLLFTVTAVQLVIGNLRAQIIDLGVENEKLDGFNFFMKANVEKATTMADNLNWTLNVILSFNEFPVNTYCPDKSECVPQRY